MRNEFLYMDFEVKSADDATGMIEGHAAAIENIDLGLDKIKEGAFSKTLKENKGLVPILSNHDVNKQIGWGIEAKEDKRGLFVKGKLEVNAIPEARAHYALVKSALDLGAKHGMSIGYSAIKWDYDQSTSIRELKEIKLYEWSLVTFPMNPKAYASAAKEWMKSNNDSVDNLIINFLDAMEKLGHTKEVVFKTLERAVTGTDPRSSQSLLEKLDRLTALLK